MDELEFVSYLRLSALGPCLYASHVRVSYLPASCAWLTYFSVELNARLLREYCGGLKTVGREAGSISCGVERKTRLETLIVGVQPYQAWNMRDRSFE